MIMPSNYLVRSWHFILMILTNFYCVPAYIIWTYILRPLQYFKPDWYYTAEGVLYSGLIHFISFWVWYLGFTVSESGDDIEGCVDSECLVLVNHQSTGDVLTMAQVITGAIRRRLSQHICWILDDMFKYTHFGAVCRIHGDIFILQGRDTRNTELARLEQHLRNIYVKRDRAWIIMFPEGGFLRNRKEVSQKYGLKHGYPHLNNCTLPRVGAVQKIMEVLSEENAKELLPESFHRTTETTITKNLKYIIDVTIGYPNGIPFGIDDVALGFQTSCRTAVHYRVYPVSSVPHDEESLLQWIYARYKEKDELLDRYYRTGSFLDQPTEKNGFKKGASDVPRTERALAWNESWCWMIHAFYILSTCVFSYVTFRFFHFVFCSVCAIAEWFTI